MRAEFSKRSKLALLKYSGTRFASNFIMLHQLSVCSGALRGLFLSDEYLAMPEARSAAGKACRARADMPAWWEKVKTISKMVKPIIHFLRVLDSMKPCISKVFEAMDTMIASLEKLVTDPDRYFSFFRKGSLSFRH